MPVRVSTDDGATLHAEVAAPDGAPVTVVLSHGWTLSAASWRGVAAGLDGARVVTYDHRGHGASSRLDGGGPTMERLAEDLRAVIETVAPSGPLVLAGHSLGGMTIMALAVTHPELFERRVAGVGLVSTSAGGLRRVTLGLAGVAAWTMSWLTPLLMRWWARRPGVAERVRRLLPPERRAVRRQVGHYLFGPDAPVDAVAECAALIHATPLRTIGGFYPALMAHDLLDRLEALRGVPVAVLVGDRDLLTPPGHSRKLAEALPDARLVVVPGAGHLLPMEQPEVVAEALRALVDGASRGLAREDAS